MLPFGDVGADVKVAGEIAVLVAQRGDGEQHRDRLAVIADVCPLAFFESFARGAAHEDVEAAQFFAELEGEPARVLDELRVEVQLGYVARADYFRRRVAEHSFRAGVEY